ncbi:DUF2975 domain-containing protein [Candidatus Dependentiae bacterium]|nr:DUF2975 domain-containing protein [Candidatus Dependentiae bacterium]
MKINTKILAQALKAILILIIPYLIVIQIIGCFYPTLLFNANTAEALNKGWGYDVFNLTLLQQSILFFLGSLSTIPLVCMIITGVKALNLVKKGEILSEASVNLFTKLKLFSLYWAACNIVGYAITSYVFMPKLMQNMNLFLISLVAQVIMHIGVFLFFAAFTAIIKRGANLQQDQDLTV